VAVKLDLDDIQGLLARGYSGLRHARFTIFAAPEPAASHALLDWLLPLVTSAAPFSADAALQVAFTPSGLRRLGLPGGTIAGFSAEFLAGMTAPDRSRFLGDTADSDPRGWAWGEPQRPPADGVVLLYAAGPDILDRRQAALMQRFAELGIGDVTELGTLELADREPFGFRDGISQPIIAGLPKATGRGRAVPAGEFVLGYPNARGQLTDRPLLPSSDDPGRLLLPDPAGTGAVDLGRNGTYLVLRQLEQDVDGFWRYLGQATRRPDGSEDPGERVALAAKMVGRWPSGAPLVDAPCRDDPALGQSNNFGYHFDPAGLACPLGAHIRRANPRDSLDAQPAASLASSDLHRLLRRGRSYGPARGGGQAGDDRRASGGQAGDDGSARGGHGTGLYFICLAASLARQFEFVQHTWLNNPTFNGLYDDADPLTAGRPPAGGTFTAPARPVRRRYLGLPQFVRTRGGAYFFLPGISALRYLAQLPETALPESAAR
jgi:Dyp-type peroxidase family